MKKINLFEEKPNYSKETQKIHRSDNGKIASFQSGNKTIIINEEIPTTTYVSINGDVCRA